MRPIGKSRAVYYVTHASKLTIVGVDGELASHKPDILKFKDRLGEGA